MIVCVCEGISDREIRAHIQGGSTSVKELQRVCGAGGDCGRCAIALRQMIQNAKSPGESATLRPPSSQGCRAA